jgi:hypothetical protein
MSSGVPPHVAGLPTPTASAGGSPAPSPGTGVRGWFGVHRPAFVLVGLAILIPELLTGSTPVASLLNPIGDLFLLGLYGGGVLVIREVALRWNRGWAPVLLLGAAYGIVEEGLGTKTFFDWAEIGRPNFGPYTHWAGVNWVWAGELTLFHAIFSIALPIALTGLLYPESGDRPFLTKRGLGWTFAAYLVTATAMFFLFDRMYVFTPYLVAGCLVAIGLLTVAAWKVPAGWLAPRSPMPTASPRAEFVLGGGFVWGFFVVFLGMPGFLRDPFLTIFLGCAFSAACLAVLIATIGAAHNEAQRAYLALGLLTFFVAFATLAELRGDLFVFLAIAVVLWLMVHLHRQYRPVYLPRSTGAGLAVD